MTCYCSEHSEEAGNESFCRKYSMDNITAPHSAGSRRSSRRFSTSWSRLSLLSEKEHHHSYTDFEKSVTWKIVTVMLLIMVLLPLFMAANMPDISLGFLFNGNTLFLPVVVQRVRDQVSASRVHQRVFLAVFHGEQGDCL